MRKIISITLIALIYGSACALEIKKESSGSIQQSNNPNANLVASKDGRYIDNGDGSITDIKTGLMWTKKDSWADLGKCLGWNKSKSYVKGLTIGGYSDWRLPTVSELKSIYEESKTSNMTYDRDSEYPIHLDKIFADSSAYEYWTSEEIGQCCAQVVYFFNGFVYGDSREECIDEGARAVRSSVVSKLPENTKKMLEGTRSKDGRYVDHGDGSITDTKTDLMWTKKDSWGETGKCMNWNDSKHYVSKLKTGGHSDWRLPTVKEL